MANLVQQVPGFRSGTRWKKYVAIIGYIIALCILGGIASQNTDSTVLGIESLLLVLLVSNTWGVRSHIPIIGSLNKLVAFDEWLGMLFFMFVFLVAVSSRGSETEAGTVASGSSGATGSAASGKGTTIPIAAKATQVPSALTAIPPTHTPPTATPAPTTSPSPSEVLTQAAQKQLGSRLLKAELLPVSLGGITENYVTWIMKWGPSVTRAQRSGLALMISRRSARKCS